MADEVVLLDFWPSHFGMRVRISLVEKGIKYEYKEENLGEKSPLLLKMNPVHKKIPILIHNGKSICESLIMVEYIDEVWNEKSPLLLTDPYERAVAKFWADYVDKKVYDNGRKICMSKGEEQKNAKKEFIEILKVLEGELGEKPYFGGANMGFLDVALIPFYSWFYSYKTCGKFSIEAECPKFVVGQRSAWRKRVSLNHFLTQRRSMNLFSNSRNGLELNRFNTVYMFLYWIFFGDLFLEQNLLDKSPLLLKMNPIHQKIHVLIQIGKTICESIIIVKYIDEVWKDKYPFLPSDPYQRAKAKFWADYIDKKVLWVCLIN
ncbi:Glutathione S-transferase [Macleaya cordata]|uniref:glutathione transferase n=1 Tax=Macleaya cordata TaxID=56857 RepID=A0A200QNL8_MACCD|nr:Glutathione S-transferase [Macleaya cordata]